MKKQKTFELYGIFGHPLGHTLSPAMQEAGFQKLGMDANYLVFELAPQAFKKTMRGLADCCLSGFNVTVPYKETVMKYLDRVSFEAKAIGAVNTVYKKNRRWIGVNTDMEGFLISLCQEGKFDPKRKKVLVFGGGGASRAVTYGLAKRGAREIIVVDAIPPKAKKIASGIKRSFRHTVCKAMKAGEPAIRTHLKDADLVLNATPLGLKKADPLVVPLSWIPKTGRRPQLFMDLVYNPAETAFLKAAKKKGHRTLGGLGMLLYQGVRGFEYWTRKKAPVSVMRQALKEAIRAKNGH